MPDKEIDLTKIIQALENHSVRYVVVGGLAVFLHGGETPTLDVDLAFATEASNLERLADALAELHAKPKRWATPSYRLKMTDLASSWLHLESEAGDIDLIPKPPGATFDELEKGEVRFQLGPVTIRVAARDDLIRMKRVAGRPRDLRHIEELEAIERLSAEHPPSP